MQRLLFLVGLIIYSAYFVLPQNLPVSFEAESFRRIQEKSFRNRQTSPLLPKDFENFKGLDYFDFNAKYRVKTKLVLSAEKKSFLIPTSTGGTRKYLKTADLLFELDGKEFLLSAFVLENSSIEAKDKEEKRDLFIPYKDLTNGGDTYSAGRYVYLKVPKNSEEAFLDFNLSHNPNCAYNTIFACTLPPKENFLQVEIRAGEKKFVSLQN